MVRLMLPVASPDAPPILARHFGWRRPMVEGASPDVSACVARRKRDSRPTLSDLSPDTRRSASRGLRNRQSAVKSSHFSRKVGSGVACIALATFCGRPPNPLGFFGRPTWATRSTDWGYLGRPTRAFRSTDPAISVARPRHFARPTSPTRSTDFAAAHGWYLELPRIVFAVVNLV